MVVCYENHTEHINVACEQKAGIVVLNVMVSSVTTGQEGLICIIGTGYFQLIVVLVTILGGLIPRNVSLSSRGRKLGVNW